MDTNVQIIKDIKSKKFSIRSLAKKYNVNIDRIRYYHYKINRPDKFIARYVDKKKKYMEKKLSTV